jgi:NAD(P)-dependent dehydrogenase (short-subunit alcohol dehydrogenase family)
MLATEFALKGIPVRVNAIAPGVFETEMTGKVVGKEGTDKIGHGVQSTPAGRPGTSVIFFCSACLLTNGWTFDSDEEIAGCAVFLASPAGGYTNGQEIIVDGGYTCVNPARV